MRSGKGGLARLFALSLCVVMLAGACGGDDDDDEGAEGENGGGSTEETTAPKIKEGGTLVFGADQDFGGYNTSTSKDNSLAGGQIMRQVWSTAMRTRPDFTLEPYLLSEDPAVVSENPFKVQWKIDPKAVWSDDTPVTADDLAYGARMCNGKTKADCASTNGYDLITKLSQPDDKTLLAEFSQPYADYKGLMGAVPFHIAKQRNADEVEAWNNGFNDDPGVSCGPWMVPEGGRVKGESLTLVANPKWWKDKAHLEKIIFRFLPESASQPDALRNNEVRMIYPQPQLDLVSQVEGLSGVHSEINFGPTFEHLTFNFKNEFLAIPEVRQAIAHTVDRQAIVTRLMKPFSDKAEVLENRALVATQTGYVAHGEDYATPDPAAAKAGLEKAGFKMVGGVMEKDGKKLSLKLSATAGNQLREQQGVLIQNQLKEVGIEIRIENYPAEDFFGDILPNQKFDIGNFAWVGTPFPASGVKQLYGSASDSNFGKYNNPKVDKMALESLGIIDDTARLAKINEIDAVMWTDLPNLPLYQKPTFLAYDESYVNVEDNTTNESVFWNSEQWAQKASAK